MMNVSVAATAALGGANGAEAGLSASADSAPSAGQSAFQALLAPAMAATAAPSDRGSVAPGASATSVDADETVAAVTAASAGQAGLDAVAQRLADAADGNDLPADAGSAAIVAGIPAAAASPAAMAQASAAAALRAGTGPQPANAAGIDLVEGGTPSSAYLDRFSSGPQRLPGLGLPDTGPALAGLPGASAVHPQATSDPNTGLPDAPSADPVDLVEAGEALSAYLDRFSSGPHRLPVTGVAAFGVAQLLKFGASNEPLRNTTSAESVRTAVDAALSPAATPHAPATAALPAPVAAGFGQTPSSAAWGQALDQQVMLMLNRGAQEARIRLHPQELGQLDIRLSMGGDRVDLNFSVQHAAVAGALQQHLPQLTQMLADQGLTLGQASVAHDQAQSGAGSAGQNGRSDGSSGFHAVAADADSDVSHLVYQPAARGLLDIFA